MKKINNLLIILMLVINIVSILLNLIIGYEVDILVCIALSIVIVLPKIFVKKLRVSDSMECVFLLFVFLAGELGSVLRFYGKIYWYDSFTHFLSGIFTSYLSIVMLKEFKKYDKKETFNILFIICFTLAVAAIWEIFEFTADSILGNDAQNVLTTGVTDTMKDIICALLGSILYIFMHLFKK